MLQEEVIEEISHDWTCVALYKIVEAHERLILPPPSIHVYLAGTITGFDEPDSELTSKYVISSRKELAEFMRLHQNDPNSRVLLYFVGRISGDFSLNHNAMITSERDPVFSSECYQIAKEYGFKTGRKAEPEIFDVLARDTERYIDLLAEYYQHTLHSPGFELIEEDFQSFKKYLKENFDRAGLILYRPKKLKKSDKLLV